MKKINLNVLSELRNTKALRETEEMYNIKSPVRGMGAMLKRTLATACVFGIALGGGTAAYKPKQPNSSASDAVAQTIMNSFGFVAYAANTGETITPKNPAIVFDSGSGSDSPEDGFFSGCLFKVTGDNIKSVSASIDKGMIYRTNRVELPNGEAVDAFIRGEMPEAKGADTVMISGTGEEDGPKKLWADLCSKLENGFTDEYDPDASYGFWAPPSTRPEDPDADLRAEWHSRVDFFDGATLNVTVTFTDGSTSTQTKKLHTGRLGVDYNDAGMYLTGEVFTDKKDYNKPYIYGVYGES